MSLPVAAQLLQVTSQPLHMACSSDITTPPSDDPWTATSLLSALLEVVLAFLFLAGATISYFTSKFVRFFGLHPPCFDQGGNWRERRSNLQRYLFCDRLSKELCTLSHGFLHRSYIENSNLCEVCSPSYRHENSCSEFDSLSSVQLVRPNRLSFACKRHLPQNAIHDMRPTCSRPQYSNRMMIRRCDDIVALQNQIWCKTDACPLHGQCGCRLAIRRRSPQRFAKRKFDNVFLEGLPDDDGMASTEAGCSQGERVRSLKVFPEEMMTNRAPSQEEICESSSMDGEEGALPNHSHGVGIVSESPGDHTQSLAGESVEIFEESIQHSSDVPEEVSHKSEAASGESAHISGVVSELPPDIDKGECAVLPLHSSGLQEREEQADSKREDSEENATDCPADHISHRQEHFLVENNTFIESPDMVSNGAPSVSVSENDNDAIKLKEALAEEREVLDSIYLELEKERISSATAADEAMAMITRLQKDKAALQLESLQYQRIAEEKSMYDQEAIAVLRDILLKREAEKLALEKEIELYRRRLLKDRIEARERERAMEEAMDVLILEGTEEQVPLLEESEVPATGGASADGFCEMDIPYERASFLFNGPRNLVDSFESVSGDYSSAGDKMAGQVDEARNGGSLSHHIDGDCSPTAVEDALNDKIKADASDQYIVNSRTAERDKDDQTEKSLAAGQVQSTAPHVAVRWNENGREKRAVRKSRGTAEEGWQYVLERVWTLEEQICQLKAKHNLELQKPLAAVQRHANSKDRSPQKLLKDRKKTSEHKNLKYESSAFKQAGLYKKPGVRDQAGNKLPKKKLRAKGEDGHSLKIQKTGKKRNQSTADDTPRISSLNCGDEIEHNCNGLVRDPFDECVRVNEVWSGRGDGQLGEPGSFLEETELPLTGAETPEEQSKLLSTTARSPSSCSTSESESSSSGEGRTDYYAYEGSQASSPRASSFDLRTTSMVMRDKSRMVVEKEVQNLMSRLQALEADRELMRQSIESMRKEREEMELLQEVAQQLRELQITEGRLNAREVSQQCDEVSSIPSIEEEKSLSNKRRCLSETLETGQHVPPSGDTTQIISGDIGC